MAVDAVINATLENARKELLDISTRNRLLNTSRSSTRSSRLEIVDELAEEVYRHLVEEGKAMGFLPLPTDDGEDVAADEQQALLFQPVDDEADENGTAARHTDNKLQTNLSSPKLQKKLLKLFYDARTAEEEQGVNILYLALGFLKWYEDDRSDLPRFAPLLLVPVGLDRQSATSQFKIRYTGDDITTNLSLQVRLKDVFGISLPEVPDDELTPSAYFEEVRRACQGQSRWEVLPNDIILWLFSFAKFLMFRDLDPSTWPEGCELLSHPLIQAMLRDGFRGDPPLCDEDANIDVHIAPIDMVHILDADSSQAVVIEEIKRGRNLVIQGPPGTGKSQTIANAIAAAVVAGKKVLFVAEKMAALEVVQRRLANIGLGDICLELHSNKAKKRAVLENLDHTLQLGKPQACDVQQHCQDLAHCRDRLNRHVEIIHSQIKQSGLTPFQVVGDLVRLRAAGTRLPDFGLEEPTEWTSGEFQTRMNLLRDLVRCVGETGPPCDHRWRGVELDVVLPMDADRIRDRTGPVGSRLERLCGTSQQLANLLGMPVPAHALAISQLGRIAKHLSSAPRMDRQSLGSDVWHDRRSQIDELVGAGVRLCAVHSNLAPLIVESAWDVDVTTMRRDLAVHGRSWFRFFRRPYREAMSALRSILVGELPKTLEERLAILDQLLDGQKTRAYLTAPSTEELGREAFGAYWRSTDSDWDALSAICRWVSESQQADAETDAPAILARIGDTSSIPPLLGIIADLLKPVLAELTGLFESVQLDLQEAFGSDNLHRLAFENVLSRLRQWQEDSAALSHWVNYAVRRRRLKSEGIAELVDEVNNGTTLPDEAVACYEMAYYESLIRSVFNDEPELASFSGASHEQLLAKFKQLDQARIEAARFEVASAHFESLPRGSFDVGEIGLVRREIQKQRRHLPIRKLLAQAGRTVQAIKPIFMMSPISIAQFIEPGGIDFDLLLIDEASQVQPVDALGAIARAKQVAVVGDNRQLPPTRFFGSSPESVGKDVGFGEVGFRTSS